MNDKFLNKIKSYLSTEDFNKFLSSFDEEEKHGFTLNKNKLKNFLDENEYDLFIDSLTKDFELKKIYEKENYDYYVYDKNSLIEKNIYPGKHLFHHQGLYYIQEPSAATVLKNIKFNENDKILDLCASPGGKSIQCLYDIENYKNAFLISNEIDTKRAKILSSNIERMGFSKSIITNNTSKELSDVFDDYFDKIILDAPCSGEGMMRKNDIAITQWTDDLVLKCSKMQKELIDDAYNMLKSGGLLIYSTCTYSKEEDEDIVDYILNKYTDMHLIEMKKIWPFDNIGEGQFYAILSKNDNSNDNNAKSYKTNYIKEEAPKTIFKYCDYNYLIYDYFPMKSLEKLKLIRVGVQYQEIKKDRLEIYHSFTHTNFAKNYDSKIELDYDKSIKYIKGESFKIDNLNNGFYIVTYNKIPLGLSKITNGILKNHYPKGLRLL